MPWRGPVPTGDLTPTGAARPLPVVVRGRPAAPRARSPFPAVSAAALLLAAAVWLGARAGRVPPPAPDPPGPVAVTEVRRPATFPPVEVPHLAGPPAPASGLARGEGSFPAAGADAAIALPPRANPRLPLIGFAPVDAARLARATLPARAVRADAAPPASAPSPPPDTVATLGPGGAQVVRVREAPEGAAMVQPPPADGATAPIPIPVAVPDASAPTASLAPEPAPLLAATPRPEHRGWAVGYGASVTAPTVRRGLMARAASPAPNRSATPRPRVGPGGPPIRAAVGRGGIERAASAAAQPGRTRAERGPFLRASLRDPVRDSRGGLRTVSVRVTVRPAAPPIPWRLPPTLKPSD